MGARRFVRVLMVFVVSILATGVAGAGASTTGWPLDAPADVLVAFGERYTAEDGSSLTHRGVDLVAASGSNVRAVLEGTVTFAGRVPAGVGATTLAVTVQSGDVRITLMPLAEVAVESGQVVEPGALLGVLAASGDRSHPESHLHVGARRGDLYIDPMAFLSPPVAAAEPHPSEAPASAPAMAPAQAPAASAPAQASPAVVAQGAGVPAPAGSAMPAASGASAPVASGVAGAAHVTAASTGATPGARSPGNVSGAEVSRQAASGVEATSAQVVAPTPLPVPLAAAVRALDLDQERVSAALTADRRLEGLASGGARPRAIVLAVAAFAGAVLLWPVWRSVSAPALECRSLT